MSFDTNNNHSWLQLGLSFIVPFVSIPTSSLLNIGENLGATTSTALSSLMSINWASIISIGALILIASLLLPQLAAWVSTLISGGTGGYSNSYGRNIERGRFTPPDIHTRIGAINGWL